MEIKPSVSGIPANSDVTVTMNIGWLRAVDIRYVDDFFGAFLITFIPIALQSEKIGSGQWHT